MYPSIQSSLYCCFFLVFTVNDLSCELADGLTVTKKDIGKSQHSLPFKCSLSMKLPATCFGCWLPIASINYFFNFTYALLNLTDTNLTLKTLELFTSKSCDSLLCKGVTVTQK